MPRRAGLESSRKVRQARKVLVGRSRRECRSRTDGRMSSCPVVPMNDDPMIPARGCHPSIIQLDNRASEQRGTYSSVQVCKCVSIQYQYPVPVQVPASIVTDTENWTLSIYTLSHLHTACPLRIKRSRATACLPSRGRNGWRNWSVPNCPRGFPCPRRYRRARSSCRPS